DGEEPPRSKPHEIQLNLFVPLLARPDIERRARYLIDKRHGNTEPREIDRFQVAVAGVAPIDAKVIVLRRMKVAELLLVLFTAIGTEHATKWPDRQAGCTQQRPAASLERSTRAVQHRQLRDPAAERTAVLCHGQFAIDRHHTGLCEKTRVWLEHRLREELPIRWTVPTGREEIVDLFLWTVEELARLLCEQLRASRGNGAEKRSDARPQQLDIFSERASRRTISAGSQPGRQHLLESKQRTVEGQQ